MKYELLWGSVVVAAAVAAVGGVVAALINRGFFDRLKHQRLRRALLVQLSFTSLALCASLLSVGYVFLHPTRKVPSTPENVFGELTPLNDFRNIETVSQKAEEDTLVMAWSESVTGGNLSISGYVTNGSGGVRVASSDGHVPYICFPVRKGEIWALTQGKGTSTQAWYCYRPFLSGGTNFGSTGIRSVTAEPITLRVQKEGRDSSAFIRTGSMAPPIVTPTGVSGGHIAAFYAVPQKWHGMDGVHLHFRFQDSAKQKDSVSFYLLQAGAKPISENDIFEEH